MLRLLLTGLLIVFLAGCQHLAGGSSPVESYRVKSWQALSTKRFADILKSASVEGQRWVNSPELFAFHFLNLSAAKNYRIDYSANRSEDNSLSTLLIIRDGFLDDSVRGDAHQFTLQKNDNGWRVSAVKRAIRCWRNDPGFYSHRLCI